MYKFKCLLGDCISENNNIYVSFPSTTQSRRLTMHLSDTSSIAQHLKNIHARQLNFGKFLLKTELEQQNNKLKRMIIETLHIRNIQHKLNRINFESSANVLKCL